MTKDNSKKIVYRCCQSKYPHMYSNDIMTGHLYWQDLFILFISGKAQLLLFFFFFVAIKYIDPWDGPFPPEAGCIRLWMVCVCVCRSGGLSGLLCGVARVVHVFSYIVMRDPCTHPAYSGLPPLLLWPGTHTYAHIMLPPPEEAGVVKANIVFEMRINPAT